MIFLEDTLANFPPYHWPSFSAKEDRKKGDVSTVRWRDNPSRLGDVKLRVLPSSTLWYECDVHDVSWRFPLIFIVKSVFRFWRWWYQTRPCMNHPTSECRGCRLSQILAIPTSAPDGVLCQKHLCLLSVRVWVTIRLVCRRAALVWPISILWWYFTLNCWGFYSSVICFSQTFPLISPQWPTSNSLKALFKSYVSWHQGSPFYVLIQKGLEH